jgi:hypothetical protein
VDTLARIVKGHDPAVRLRSKGTAIDNLSKRARTGNTLGASGIVKGYSYTNSKGTTVTVPERKK